MDHSGRTACRLQVPEKFGKKLFFFLLKTFTKTNHRSCSAIGSLAKDSSRCLKIFLSKSFPGQLSFLKSSQEISSTIHLKCGDLERELKLRVLKRVLPRGKVES